MAERPLSHQVAFKTHKLQPGETIERTWAAGVPWSQNDSFRGRLSKFGGNLVLTDRRLLFEPLQSPKVGRAGRDLDMLFLEGKRAYELSDLAAVEPFSTKPPPRLKLTLGSGEELVLGVMKSRTATIWSKDTSARDDAVAAISAAIGAR